MERGIDPLLVLEQIISSNEVDAGNAEVPEADYLDSINTLAEELMEQNSEQNATLQAEESAVNSVPLVDAAILTDEVGDPLAVPEDPLGIPENVIHEAPLPSAPDFSFMDLVTSDDPVVILDPPPLIAFGQNNAGSKSAAAKKNSSKKANAGQNITFIDNAPKKMMNQQFRAKLMTNIKQLSTVSQREQSYRHSLFPDENAVVNKPVHCTICGVHIGCTYNMNIASVTHPLLKVLVCLQCKASYMQADWTLGPEGKDVRCRWCSKPQTRGNSLRNCSQCPFAFCQACVTRNFSKAEWELTMSKAHWMCYGCQMIPFFLSRAICWALGRFVNSPYAKQNGPKKQDLSTCCSNKKKKPLVIQGVTPPTTSKVLTVVPGKNGSIPQQSVEWVKTRINNYFEEVGSIQSKMTSRLNERIVTFPDKTLAVQDLVNFLTRIAGLTSTTSMAIHNWHRLQSPNGPSPIDKTDQVMTVLSGSRAPNIGQQANLKNQKPALKRAAPASRSIHPSKKLAQSRNVANKLPCKNWNELVKKYNIRPCYVLLERWVEDPVMEDFSHLLIPTVELRVDGTIVGDDEECIIIE